MATGLRSVPRVAAIFMLLVSLIGSAAGTRAAPRGDVNGNTYTSPQFGFTVTWDNTWFVTEEEQDEWDAINLTDGLSYARVAGFESAGGVPQLAMAYYLSGFRFDESVSNFQIAKDAAGNDLRGDEATRSWAVVTFTVTFDDGSSMEITEYSETRTLVPGSAVLIFRSYCGSQFYEAEYPQVMGLLSGVVIPGQAGTSTGTGTGTTTTPAGPVVGEPGPVFVSGQWRIAIARVAMNETFPAVGLKERGGKAWFVVVADVTNWSDEDGEFAARELKARAGADGDLLKAATGSTANVAKKLDVEPVTEELLVALDAGATERVVLVFLIPGESEDLELVHETVSLPVNDVLEIAFDPAALPGRAVPPVVKTGELVSASDGKTLRVQIEGENSAMKVRLLGVDPPVGDACFANEAEVRLDGLAGEQVLVEEDAAITGGSTQAQYLWLVNLDGTRTLINQMLIAEGLAGAGEMPEEARFGLWMAETARIAQETPVGMWLECEES